MRMKKVILALVVILVVGQTSMTVMAHGHSRSYRSYRNYQSYQGNVAAPAVTYAACSVEGCNVMGIHEHNGTYYCGHYYGDGHDYHQLCSVQGCTMTGVHDHDGVACMPHSAGDGHSYHNTGGYHRGRHH